jgi:hypothetical protein
VPFHRPGNAFQTPSEKIIRKKYPIPSAGAFKNEAYISALGRRLKLKEIAVAYILFPSIDMHFVCDSIAVSF